MASVFVKVKCSDRLPKEDGNYIVGYEYGSFQCSYSKEFLFYEEFTDCSIIEWWFEEIELPSDEYITIEADKIDNWKESYEFERGANFILNKLK